MRSTWARASPTSTARPRSSPRRSRRCGRGATSTPPASACPSCATRSRATSSGTTGSSSTPTPRWSSRPAPPRAVAAALLGLVNPGDEVVVLEPYYDSYVAMMQMAGAVRRPVTLRAPDFRLDPDDLRAAVTPRTRFVLLNSPHNPTGTVLTRAELEAVAAIAIEHDLVVITDEVYEHLVFDDHEHVPISTLPGMARADAHALQRGQVLLLHGLEGRLGHRTGRAGRRRARGQAVADLHLRLAAAARRRPCAGRRAGLPTRARRRPAGAARPALRRPDQGGPGAAGAGGDLLRRRPTSPTSAGTTAWSSASPCPSGPAWWPIPAQVFYDDPDAPGAGRHLVRWAFCKDAAVIEDGVRRLQESDLAR